MKITTTICFVVFAASLLAAASKPGADEAWKRFETAAAAIKQVPQAGSSGGGASDSKALLAAADDAGAYFVGHYSDDARRWQVALFDVKTAQSRAALGLPPRGEPKDLLKRISEAHDAPSSVRGEASALLVIQSYNEISIGWLKQDTWLARAARHLESYPSEKLNTVIRTQLAHVRNTISAEKRMEEIKRAPLDLHLEAIDGTQLDVAKLRGRAVLIVFWSAQSPSSLHSIRKILDLQDKARGAGLEVVGISTDLDPAQVRAFAKKEKITWPLVCDGKGYDGDVLKRLDVHSSPLVWVLDRKGMVLSTDAREKLPALVARALGE